MNDQETVWQLNTYPAWGQLVDPGNIPFANVSYNVVPTKDTRQDDFGNDPFTVDEAAVLVEHGVSTEDADIPITTPPTS